MNIKNLHNIFSLKIKKTSLIWTERFILFKWSLNLTPETSEKSPFYLHIGKELKRNSLNCCHLSGFKSTLEPSKPFYNLIFKIIFFRNEKLFTKNSLIFQFKISFSNFIRLAEGHCS